MSRQLLVVPNEILRRKCMAVGRITLSVRLLARSLYDFLGVEHDGVVAVSVSASQLGKSVRMFAFRSNPYSTIPSTQVLINPKLVYGKKLHTVNEMCLSIPGKEFVLQRYELVKVRGMMLDGSERSFRERGIVAQAFQHELNHLDGILIDTLGEEIKE